MYKTDFGILVNTEGGSAGDTQVTNAIAAKLTSPRQNSNEQRPILVHSHLRWDFVWQRPQHILSRLAAFHPILFTEEPMSTEDGPRLDISEPQDNVVRVIPLLPPYAKDVDAQCAAMLPLVRDALEQHPTLRGRFDAPIQWFYSPMTAPCFAGRFNAASTVYDCMDELSQFRFAPADIREREQFLLSRADLVFTGGYHLFEAKSRHHPNVHFYGCGVDIDHFGKARAAETPVACELADLPRPIFGYFGVIDERLDYQLLAQLAEQAGEASIVMVGPVAKVNPGMLPRLPNIHWLGQRDYAALPSIVKGFDVCLMPFALNEATQYINPTKTYEYMAAGKPVVSSAVPDVVRNFAPIVRIARSHEDFIGAVGELARNPQPHLIEQGIERAMAASWDSIVTAMRGHLLASVRGAGDSAPARPRGFP